MKSAARLDNAALYEQEGHWTCSYDKWFYRKKRLFASLVSEDVRSVLDVGCGNGEITNDFCKERKIRVVGCDRSAAALAHVTVEKVRAECDVLPFDDGEFDLVMCSEVLEHLPKATLEKTVKELARVSNRYVLISVPYRETLAAHVTRCADCSCRYHVWGHLNSFRGPERIGRLFPGFAPVFTGFLGDREGRPPEWFMRLRHRLLADWAASDNAICPRCGSKRTLQSSRTSDSRLRWFLDRVQWRLSFRRMSWWMIVMFDGKSS